MANSFASFEGINFCGKVSDFVSFCEAFSFQLGNNIAFKCFAPFETHEIQISFLLCVFCIAGAIDHRRHGD